MALIRYRPMGLLSELRREMDNLFEQGNGSMELGQWSLPVDIKDEANQFTVKTDIPGIKPEDIELSVEGNTLTIKGERKEEKKTEEEGYTRIERHSGSCYRCLTLPDSVDADAIKAESKEGVLTVVLPKKKEAGTKAIKVTAK